MGAKGGGWCGDGRSREAFAALEGLPELATFDLAWPAPRNFPAPSLRIVFCLIR